MSAAEQAATYCSALLGGPDGDDRLAGLYATVWTAGHKRTLWRPADNPGAVASLIAELDADPSTAAVYMCTTLHDQERSCDNLHGQHRHEGHCKYRPGASDSAGLISIWLDIDIAGDGHSDSPYPPDINSAMRLVAEMRLPPTLVVQSGGGLHVYWVLTEPWLVRDAADPDAERQTMADLVRNWTYAAKYHAHRLGRWKIDSTFDLARLLRPAGSTNRKIEDEPRPVRILRHDPDATYNPDDFADVLPDSTIIDAYAAPTGITSVSTTAEQQEVLKEVNLGAVYARVNSPAYKDADFTPEWLADLLENVGHADPDSLLIKTWLGKREDGPKPFKNDQSTYDASLMRLLADLGVDTESLVEALMCRRLRAGATTDKIDPRKRIDYIARTVARFRLESKRSAEVKKTADDRIAAAARLTVTIPDDPPDIGDPGDDPLAPGAEQAFLDYTQGLVDHKPGDEGVRRKRADMQVVTQHTGQSAPDRPGAENDEDPFSVHRHELEQQCLDTLTELLVPKEYRERGVSVWRLEYRDHGEQQKGRLLFRLPVDFAWPVSPPVRYRPGRPLPTDWWRRDVFDGPKGFAKAMQRDCLIVAKHDAKAEEWTACIRSLIPLWRRDSTGADLATHAREWLFGYLMLFHGTGQINEVLAHGRPWVRAHNDWQVNEPPVIYIDVNEFLEHCRRQPGAVVGRNTKDVVEYLHLTKRRPRLNDAAGQTRRTWYEIGSEQFTPDEWDSIITVTRRSFEISETNGRLRAVQGGKR